MVKSRVHLICGNCGCNDEWSWTYCKDSDDNGDGTADDDVLLKCGNCSTIHSMNEITRNDK